MLKALIWKEVRELMPAIVSAIAAQAFLVCGLYYFSKNESQDAEAIWPLLYFVALLFAIFAGSAQIWRETSGGNFQFLLHRPVGREAILGIKMAVGSFATLLVVAVPLLVFSLYLDSWYRWHDVTQRISPRAWQLVAGILLFYLGAFLSGLIPGRWYVSQFLPLLAAILLFAVLQMIADVSRWWTPTIWFAALAAAPVLELCYVVAILHVARMRDYS